MSQRIFKMKFVKLPLFMIGLQSISLDVPSFFKEGKTRGGCNTNTLRISTFEITQS